MTSYFNPVGYRSRRANYEIFRRHLELPLLTVEWSPDGRFELGPQDADQLVQLAGGDLMWQKERLLNIGIARLPAQCTHVAWVDCDIVFERTGLADAIVAGLRSARVIQLFDRALQLDRGSRPGDPECVLLREEPGIAASELESVTQQPSVLASAPAVPTRPRAPGYAWAARRELLERHPLFDTWVVGGGDRAFHCALTGAIDELQSRHGLSQPHLQHFLPRARALQAHVDRQVGYLGGAVFALWHGLAENRRYVDRHRILADHAFDPARSLRAEPSGVWAWAADVPSSLPKQVDAYFVGRDEDGVGAAQLSA